MNAESFKAIETLKNGSTVTIRAIRPTDKAAIVQAFGMLKPESVYTRFFQHKQAFSNQELKAATEIDFQNVIALVVTIESDGKEILIGGGRYMVIDPSSTEPSAEIAFTIEENYHGLGIAGRLLKHLVNIARENGVSRFEADVLMQNKAMLAVFSRCGLPMEQNPADGAIHVTLSLTESTEATFP